MGTVPIIVVLMLGPMVRVGPFPLGVGTGSVGSIIICHESFIPTGQTFPQTETDTGDHSMTLIRREELEQLEQTTLAPYAQLSRDSAGREHAISPDQWRTEFQRDRDRIIHCAAFRKLEYKTQVYMIHHGDYFRTRLTHTMEVAQIARTLARNLRVNQDLTEAIALAHDLGHTPFGHSGEAAIRRLLEAEGGFEHNEQSLRVLERLEERYPHIPGLNLTYEVREGIIKHATEYDNPRVPERFRPELAPPLESQICDVADEIAYNNHDIDDAMKMGLITQEDLREVPWVQTIFEQARSSVGADKNPKFITYRAIGQLIDLQVCDVLTTALSRIESQNITSVDEVRHRKGRHIVGFSAEMGNNLRQLKSFLLARVYQHPRVIRMNRKAEMFITRLFELYRDNPEILPLKYQCRIEEEGLLRVVTDYISGMTDRFLIDEYTRAFEPTTHGF
jgi:dGTPase